MGSADSCKHGSEGERGAEGGKQRTLTCSTMMLQFVLGLVRARGGPIDDLPGAVGVSAKQLAEIDGRVPLTALLELWNHAARRLGDDNFGLHAAQVPPSGIISVVNLAGRCSPNLRELWRRTVRFAHLAVDGPGPRLEEKGDSAFLRFLPDAGQHAIPRHPTEFALASFVIGARRATQAPLIPRAARFYHPRPRDVSMHAQVFGIPVTFDQPCSEIEFDRSVLDLPIHNDDPMVTSVMERYAEEWLARLNVQTSLIDQVRRHIYSELGSGVPSASLIAKRLSLSERTFSRRLRQEGESYPELVNDVRKGLSIVYLRDPQLKLSEVAFLLGFSELSAFYRAFRRWTGMTPAQARVQGSGWPSRGAGRA